jgi:hypothetical protein
LAYQNIGYIQINNDVDPRNKTALIAFKEYLFDLWAWQEVRVIWFRVQQEEKLEASARDVKGLCWWLLNL